MRALAQRMASACQLAYRTNNVGNHIGLHANVTRDDQLNAVIVAFRGSASATDWFSNLDRHQARFPMTPGWIHRGFGESMDPDTMVDLRDAIAELRQRGDGVYATGHSRGAAQATIFASRYWVDGLWTFGSPRVGDGDFARDVDRRYPLLSDKHLRYVFESDPVVHLPLIGYRHCGRQRWWDGKKWRDDMPWLTQLGVYVTSRKRQYVGDALDDHSIQCYIDALEHEG